MNIKSLLNTSAFSHTGGTIKNSLKVVKNATLAFALSTTPVATAKTTICDIPKASIYTKSKSILEDCISEHPSFYMFEAARQAVSMDINTGQFNKALIDNKKQLMKELHINNKTYDSYMELTKTIGQDERCFSFDSDPNCYSPFDTSELFSAGISDDLRKDFNSVFKDYKPYVPIDIERFVVKGATDEEKVMFDKFGIDFSDENITPNKRAIATIIHLNTLDKEYPQYLKEVSALRPDYSDKSVMESVRNAERIMSDEILGPFAIAELDASARQMSYIMGDIGEIKFDLLSKKDLEDLRIYASGIVLSKDMYLVERWDNHPILPKGKDKDSACANILSFLLNKTE